jgi:glycosyltransferase involved in cell wall biosynthesis
MGHHSHNNRIGFFISSESWINHQQWHYKVAKALYGRGYEIVAIAPKKSKLYAKLKRYGIQVYHFKPGFLFLPDVVRLSGIFRRENVDTLFLSHPKDVKKVSLAANFAGINKVIYRRGTVSKVKKNPINKWIFSNLISNVITNSDANKNLMPEKKNNLFSRNKINVIYNGLEFPEFDNRMLAQHHYKKNGELIIGLLTGHYNTGKFLQLLQMIKGDRDHAHKYRFLIYGNSNKKAELGNRLKNLGIERELISWDNRSKDLLEFMNSIDVFISASTKHSFNYPVLYAMALNKPVIGYDKGSTPEMVKNNTNGFLIRKGDLHGIREKLDALTDKDLRNRMGKEAKDTIKFKFDFERSIDRIEELIRQ